MAIYRAQIAFKLDSALPRDAMVITPHYTGTDPQALANTLKTNLLANAQVGATTPFTVTIYLATGPPPHFPLATASSGTSFANTTSPRELALCLSYYSGFNRPRFRGRLYIPGYLAGGASGLRPSSTNRTNVASFGPTLGKNLGSGNIWVVYSRRAGEAYPVDNYWVDDEWDVVRSRGLKATTRTTGTIP